MKLLITYFEPFGGEARNASAEAAALLPDRIGDWTLIKARLPVVFGQAGERCGRLIREQEPNAVLMLGQAGSRRAVTPELTARNRRWARIPDNAGNRPLGSAVVPGGEDALFATLPVEAMAAAIREGGLPGALSCSAGLYVCNDLYYSVLHLLRGTEIPAAFVHVHSAEKLHPTETARALTLAIQTIMRREALHA
ncbi:MAG: pyroglutamyl-peptidase I [Oscillospiraceae bacterium]|nr:pyroglutamyl-peptidase I [Oscillospiraceae bacterium]